MTRRACARLERYCLAVMRLPAFNSAAVKDFVCCFVHFIRLVSLNEFLHVFSVFVIFAGYDQVHVRRVFTFNEDTVFCRSQVDLAGVSGVDNGQSNLRVVQGTWQLWCFQLNNLQVFRVFSDIQRGWQQTYAIFQFDQANLLQQQQGTTEVSRVVWYRNLGARLQFVQRFDFLGVACDWVNACSRGL